MRQQDPVPAPVAVAAAAAMWSGQALLQAWAAKQAKPAARSPCAPGTCRSLYRSLQTLAAWPVGSAAVDEQCCPASPLHDRDEPATVAASSAPWMHESCSGCPEKQMPTTRAASQSIVSSPTLARTEQLRHHLRPCSGGALSASLLLPCRWPLLLAFSTSRHSLGRVPSRRSHPPPHRKGHRMVRLDLALAGSAGESSELLVPQPESSTCLALLNLLLPIAAVDDFPDH